MKDKVEELNGFKGDIRKITAGTDPKQNSLSFEVDRTYNLGKHGTAEVTYIEEVQPEVYIVYIKRGESTSAWKKITMPVLVEYSHIF